MSQILISHDYDFSLPNAVQPEKPATRSQRTIFPTTLPKRVFFQPPSNVEKASDGG